MENIDPNKPKKLDPKLNKKIAKVSNWIGIILVLTGTFFYVSETLFA